MLCISGREIPGISAALCISGREILSLVHRCPIKFATLNGRFLMETHKTFDGVTLHGMPVHIELQWPFHPSGGGSDWYVLHGTLRLADGGPLYADIALNLAQTIRGATAVAR